MTDCVPNNTTETQLSDRESPKRREFILVFPSLLFAKVVVVKDILRGENSNESQVNYFQWNQL